MQKASQDHEDVEHAVKPGPFGADAVEDGADRVGDATQKQEHEAGGADIPGGLAPEGEDGPAHADVADHGKHPVGVKIDGGEHGCQNGHGPLKAEEPPAQLGVDGTDGRQGHHRVGSADQEIDGAVINDLHHLFAHARLQPVVDAGYAVQGNHAAAEYGGGHNAVDILPQGGEGHAQAKGRHAHGAAHDMGDGIHDFFPGGVVGQRAVCQLCSFHHKAFLPAHLLYAHSIAFFWPEMYLLGGLYRSTRGRGRILPAVEIKQELT